MRGQAQLVYAVQGQNVVIRGGEVAYKASQLADEVLFRIMCVGYRGVCLLCDSSPSFLQKFALGGVYGSIIGLVVVLRHDDPSHCA